MGNRGFLALVVMAALLGGCTAGGASSRANGTVAPSVSGGDADAVRTGTDDFFKAAANHDAAAITAMVWPGQAKGFNAQSFIDDRFRMKASEYQIYVWDPVRTKIAKVRETGDLLTSTVVAVRVMQTNEARPVYVNLHWRRDRGKWWLLPYPEAA